MHKKGITRRDFLKVTASAACISAIAPFTSKATAQTFGNELFWVTDIPVTLSGNYHPGIDGLLSLMGFHGLRFYKSPITDTDQSGPLGMIASDDVVLIKVNAQWKYRGCTNSDLIRGLIQCILDHPDGFFGEIIIFENGQGRGSLRCDTLGGGYPDTSVHANAEDESHSFSYLVDTVFNDPRVSAYLLDPIRARWIGHDDHSTDGYRTHQDVSYPCFTSHGGKRIELMEGIWDGSGYSQKLKLINVPVLKHHDTGGSEITASLKHFYGVVSMSDGQSGYRHYGGLGETCGKMVVSVRTPVLNIIDAIWVSHSSLAGYPENTTRQVNQVIASQDPVALDYWASKYILYPIDGNYRHHPDFAGISQWLIDAANTINGQGGIYNPGAGILVGKVTKNEAKMIIHKRSAIVVLLEPNGGKALPAGSKFRVAWEALSPAARFSLQYSMDGGRSWNPIADDVTERFYDWSVPVPSNNRRKCLVKVTGYDTDGVNVGADRSDDPFTIEVVKVTKPVAGDSASSGETIDITWQTNATKSNVVKTRAFYTKNGGVTWTPLGTMMGNTGTYPWHVNPVNKLKKQCKVKVLLLDGKGNILGSASSEGFFTIHPL